MVREHLDPHELADDCALIVSELVTNAVVHGGSAVRLTLTAHTRTIYAEIADDGEGRLRVSDGDVDATGGRGLLIVGTLAREWGVITVAGGGKIVWFLLEK
jgi:anti-sigma regulatory factor (Ser/Thr protein kinase)